MCGSLNVQKGRVTQEAPFTVKYKDKVPRKAPATLMLVLYNLISPYFQLPCELDVCSLELDSCWDLVPFTLPWALNGLQQTSLSWKTWRGKNKSQNACEVYQSLLSHPSHGDNISARLKIPEREGKEGGERRGRGEERKEREGEGDRRTEWE